MTKRTTLLSLVKQQCCNFESDKCLGIDLFSNKRFKEEGGICWIEEKKPCGFFAKCVLPLNPELTDEYNELVDNTEEVESNSCSCGREIGIKERKCAICKASTRRLRNRRFRLRRLG